VIAFARFRARGPVRSPVTALSFALVTALSGAASAGPEESATTAQAEVQAADRESGSVQAAVQRTQSQLVTVEQRLANGEILYRMAIADSKSRAENLSRAELVFSEIIEGFPDTRNASDATWLRGESYYAGDEYLSARRDYRSIVDRANDPRYAPYVGRAVARLVDVAIRLQDFASLDDVFQKMNVVPPSQVDAALTYARGKAYYFRKDYANASSAFGSVPNGALYGHQARYFQGLVRMKDAKPTTSASGAAVPANYRPAIEAFRAVTDLPPDTAEHRHVIDLAWMAMGRLFYEMEQYQQAVEMYNRVGRDSPEFDTMLYELAWTFVRLGDVQRAERALEVLAISNPESSFAGDGTLLRADLLLRAGAFDKALQLYLQVRDEFEPTQAKLETFLASTQDPSAFYDRLMAQQMDTLDQSDQLPPITVKWAREMEDGPAAFRIIDDLNECKQLIRSSEVLVEKLMSVVTSPSRVRAFPELKAGEEQAVGLLNRLARARVELARGMDDQEPAQIGGEIEGVRATRRQMMGAVMAMPVTTADFEARDTDGLKQWNGVSQELSRRLIEIDRLQATANGLRRVLKEDTQRGVARDATSMQRFQAEIDSNERQLKLFREESSELRRQIDIGRAQVGLGDARYQTDATSRASFRDSFDREVQLAQQGAAGADAQRYASRIWPILVQARSVEDRLTSAFADLDRQVAGRIDELKGKIEAERTKIVGYQGELVKLDGEARDLVGRVAQRNFILVRDKVRGIVLRSDVGITEQAWEVREEELERVRTLQTERARQEQVLDEELKEVLDDSVDPGAGPQK
jgi:tetratricopeptide (TPR) repeat protein